MTSHGVDDARRWRDRLGRRRRPSPLRPVEAVVVVGPRAVPEIVSPGDKAVTVTLADGTARHLRSLLLAHAESAHQAARFVYDIGGDLAAARNELAEGRALLALVAGLDAGVPAAEIPAAPPTEPAARAVEVTPVPDAPAPPTMRRPLAPAGHRPAPRRPHPPARRTPVPAAAIPSSPRAVRQPHARTTGGRRATRRNASARGP